MSNREEVPQLIHQAEGGPATTLKQGCSQYYEGYLRRQSKILKRWKLEWLKIEPGKIKILAFYSAKRQ